jgi:hypothetical protein
MKFFLLNSDTPENLPKLKINPKYIIKIRAHLNSRHTKLNKINKDLDYILLSVSQYLFKLESILKTPYRVFLKT